MPGSCASCVSLKRIFWRCGLKSISNPSALSCVDQIQMSLALQFTNVTTAGARAVARGQKMGGPFKLTDHQKREAIKRRNQGEMLADIARSYNVSPATISRLTA